MTTPDVWPKVRLGDIGQSLIGLTYSPDNVRRSGTLVLRSSNIQGGRLVLNDNVYVDSPIPARIRVRPNDILICVRNGSRQLIGKSVMLDDRVVGQTFGAFMAVYRSSANPLLRYFFQSDDFKRQIDEHLGATINQITNGSLNNFEVSLPPEREQSAIVERLQDADGLISTLDRVIAKKNAIKTGMMQQLLTGRTRLPGFVDEWRLVRLGDHVTYIKTVALSRAQLDDTSALRYLHYGDIHTRTSVRLCAAEEPMPRAARRLAGSAGLLHVGDLIFADASEDVAGVGKSVEISSVPSEGVVPGLHTIAARFDKAVLADGFKAYIQFIPSFRDSLLRLAAGTKVLATTRAYISGVTLYLPSVEEQRAIADVLLAADSEIDALRNKLMKAEAIKTGMMQQLLTGRTRLPLEASA